MFADVGRFLGVAKNVSPFFVSAKIVFVTYRIYGSTSQQYLLENFGLVIAKYL